MKRHIFALVVAVLFVVLPAKDSIRASASSYTVEDLGTFEGLVPTITGMNASGQLSGFTRSGTIRKAVRYTNGIGWELVPGVNASNSTATAINASGDVAGFHAVGTLSRAFRYENGTGITTTLGTLPGGSFTVGLSINASGVMTGHGDSSSGTRGWRAAPGLPLEMLPTLGGATGMTCGINDAGQIVGLSTNALGRQHAYRVEVNDAVTDIVPLDGPDGMGRACAIDASGRVGGNSTSGTVTRAFVSDGGPSVNVDTFVSDQSTVESVSAGVAVGWFLASGGAGLNAFVHTDANGSTNLNDLIPPGTGWHLQQALAVNTAGQIAGVGLLNGVRRAFRLTPTGPAADTTAPVISAVTATPSTVWPPNGALVSVTVSVAATDDTDPAPVCSLTSVTADTTTGEASITAALSASVRAVGGTTYTLSVSCTDAAGNVSPASSTTVVVPPDTTAPVISSVHATPGAVWPPNGKMVSVTVTVSASDDVDSEPQCSLTSVTSNGGTAADAVVTGQFTADVRAEKNGDGAVRVYKLNVTCADRANNASGAAASVFVGKDAAEVNALALRKSKR